LNEFFQVRKLQISGRYKIIPSYGLFPSVHYFHQHAELAPLSTFSFISLLEGIINR